MIFRLLEKFDDIAVWTGGLAILAMVVLGGIDMLTTLLLNWPLPAVFEATQMLMVFAIFLPLGLVHRRRTHVVIDLIYNKMPPGLRRACDLLVLVLMLAFFAAISYRGWLSAVRSYNVGEYTAGVISFPVYPARFALAVGATLALLACIADLLRGGYYWMKRPDASRTGSA